LCAAPETGVAIKVERFEPDKPFIPCQHTDPIIKVPLRPLDLAILAEYTGLAINVIRDVHDLFFNVRDRFNEKNYLASLVYPNSNLGTLSSDFQQYGSIGQKPRIVGFEKGAEEVVRLGGVVREADVDKPMELKIREYEAALFAKADFELNYGDRNAPVIATMVKFLQGKQKTEYVTNDMRAGLTAVSLKYEMNEMIKASQAPEVKKRLAAQSAALASNASGPVVKSSDASVIKVHHDG
jgi:hypothetical protein